MTNDDGIYAPGLAAMERVLQKMGHVTVVAPATEQSGVGHAITFLSPLTCKPVYQGERQRGWAVDGTPADCVKIGIFEFFDQAPDLIVSGINGGLNAGINVLYSGTVAAAIEGAFFGIDSFAVSLEYDERANFDRAAEIGGEMIQQVLANKGPQPQLFNINVPTAATRAIQPPEIRIVPMGLERYGQDFIKRSDPKGRSYFWASGNPPPASSHQSTDVSALKAGLVTVTPLAFDMTKHDSIDEMATWNLGIAPATR